MAILIQIAVFLAILAATGALFIDLGSNGFTALAVAGNQLLSTAIAGTVITLGVALAILYFKAKGY